LDEVPPAPKVEPVTLYHLLEDQFGKVGVMSPDGRLFVNLAWLYHEASLYMETVRKAAQEMADEDALIEVLAGLEDYVDSIIHYANEAKPEIKEIFEDH